MTCSQPRNNKPNSPADKAVRSLADNKQTGNSDDYQSYAKNIGKPQPPLTGIIMEKIHFKKYRSFGNFFDVTGSRFKVHKYRTVVNKYL
jgi:hypothetical protein